MNEAISHLNRLLEYKQGRALGGVLLALFCICILFPAINPYSPMRRMLFDGYQRVFPRTPESSPVVIVEIDEKSVNDLGQWPWPRNLPVSYTHLTLPTIYSV